MGKPRRVVRPCLDRLDDRCLLSGYTVAQVTQAYGLNAISFPSASGQPSTGDGSGETIALIEAYHDPNLSSDVRVFDQSNGLPDPNLSVADQAGTRTDAVWASEETLDVEWSHAIAPGAAILVVEAPSDSLGDLITAVDLARNTPGVATVSMSWGFGETAGETALDSHFQTPAGHQGITFVAASGDDGAANGPEYPSSSPRVLAVGGTTLSTDGSGNYVGESTWSGSGGGYSPYEPEPAYQASVQTTRHRSTPDVAFLADPYSGVEVYETPPGGSVGSWLTVGGTSLGTPAWAAIIAIVDQGRALQGKPSLDGPTQTLPAALQPSPPTDFHTVFPPPPASPLGRRGQSVRLLLAWLALRRRHIRQEDVAPGRLTGSQHRHGPRLADRPPARRRPRGQRRPERAVVLCCPTMPAPGPWRTSSTSASRPRTREIRDRRPAAPDRSQAPCESLAVRDPRSPAWTESRTLRNWSIPRYRMTSPPNGSSSRLPNRRPQAYQPDCRITSAGDPRLFASGFGVARRLVLDQACFHIRRELHRCRHLSSRLVRDERLLLRHRWPSW